MALLAARGLSRRYGAVVALRSADLTVEPGEIHALVGANGAGKSTLVKMLTGVIRPDSGTITVRDRPVSIASPAAAQRVGLAAVFQDPALVPDLTVLQNLRLTGTDVAMVRRWLQMMELGDVDLGELVADLPLPILRILDLARALARDPQLLLLDEITAALPSDLAERVFAVMRRWREQGRSVLFISHRLAEVRAICDRATVLRDGRDVGTLVPTECGEEEIVALMLGPAAVAAGEKPEQAREGRSAIAAAQQATTGDAIPLGMCTTPGVCNTPLLEVQGLRAGGAVNDVSLSLRSGEILGVAALEGQGQDILFDCLSGRRRADGGEIRVQGQRLAPRTPYDAIRAGVVLVPADRLQALLPQRSVRENIAMPLYNRVMRWGPINARDESRRVGAAIARLSIDTRAQRQARRLSGGNQQKVTVGRWLAAGFRVMLCFDPTRGIDVGTKRQIYTVLRELASSGAAILLFTSELPEIQLVCDRVVVLYEGRIVGEMAAADADEGALLRAAHGLTRAEEAVV
jgi:ribose transport system ATP-binding protein